MSPMVRIQKSKGGRVVKVGNGLIGYSKHSASGLFNVLGLVSLGSLAWVGFVLVLADPVHAYFGWAFDIISDVLYR